MTRSSPAYHIIIALLCMALAWDSAAQSASEGNTYIHEQGESVVFGQHSFLVGGNGIFPGLVGTERRGDRGFLGFSNVSLGWISASDDDYVDGYVLQYGSGPFTFPIGADGAYRPIAIGGAAETAAAYYRGDASVATSADFFGVMQPALPAGAPFDREIMENGVHAVSSIEYWDIDGDGETSITLTWDYRSDINTLTNYDLRKLSIVGWDGSQWRRIPSTVDIVRLNTDLSTPTYTGGVSTLIEGSITTDISIRPNDYLAYTFAAMSFGTIGDLVWEDMNRDGRQDEGEPPLDSVLIELYHVDKAYVATTSSDASGKYYFDNVLPGRYFIKVIRPDGYNYTLAAQGSNDYNSDINFMGYSIPFRVKANEPKFDIDVGLYQNGSIGDFVWIDNNGNGIQDTGEPGVKDIEVILCDIDGKTLASTVTDAMGRYSFHNIPPGRYRLKTILPDGLQYAPYHSTTDTDRDSDIDPLLGTTAIVELMSGDVLMGIDIGISSPCQFDASIRMERPQCDATDGELSVLVSGDTGPYTYQWSTGGTTHTISSLAPGEYSVTITDQNNCQRSLIVLLEEEECQLVCADIQTAVLLEGSYDYDANKMHARLNELGYLPGQKPSTFFGKYTEAGQPYDRKPWHHMGGEGLKFDSKNKGNNSENYPYDAVDWVLVSLRSDKDIEYEVCTRAGLLLEDGTIEFVEDENCCVVNPRQKYYVVVEHRNHLIVMSPDPVSVTEDSRIHHDFRYTQSYIRLLGHGQKEVAPGVFAMYAGNGDQYINRASPVDLNVGDITEWLKENGEHSSYYFQDYDLNGDANVQDKGLYLENIGIFTDVPKSEG